LTDETTARERRDTARLALAMVETCVRNSGLETLHAGTFPRSATGDYTDVTVATPYGDIPWREVSRISDDEMKTLMIEIVDRVFTYLSFPEELAGGRTATHAWNRPRLNVDLMKAVRRRQAGREIGEVDPDPA
jgi:ligand-binding SRPBCC domain-containing protein